MKTKNLKRRAKDSKLHRPGLKIHKLLFFLLLPLLLSSCAAIGPDFSGLDAPEQSSWIEDNRLRKVSGPEDLSQWWTGFNDPILNRLIETAHKQNVSLQVAGLRVLAARARLGIAVGNQFPQKNELSGSYTNRQASDIDADAISLTSNSDQIGSLALSSTWELDFWGRFRRSVEAEEASLYAAYASYDDFLVLLNAEIASTYINLAAFSKRLKIARQNVALQKRSLEITQVRFRNASTTELDVRRAETLLMQTQSLIPILELGAVEYKNGLAVLLGMTPAGIDAFLDDTELRLPRPPSTIATGVPTDLLRRRPDIRRAELQAARESARIGVAKADLFPSFYLAGALGRIDQDVYTEGGNASYNYALIRPGFSWKVLNFGRIKNAIRIQDAMFQQAILNYENSVINAYREVESAMASVTRRTQQVQFLSKSVAASKRSVELALIQYRDGVIDYTPVINTQARLAADEDSHVVSQGEVLLGVIATYKALGGGWETRLSRDLVSDELKTEMTMRTDWGEVLLPPPDKPGKLPASPRKIYSPSATSY